VNRAKLAPDGQSCTVNSRQAPVVWPLPRLKVSSTRHGGAYSTPHT
jgi:hypothetical protein